MADDLLDECATCKQTRYWHMVYNPEHAFRGPEEPVSATFGRRRSDGTGNNPPSPQNGAEAVSVVPWPHDPVLRQALIDKGVLTPDDLRDAEAKIRAVTAQFMEEVRDGQQQGG